ncbi:MAG: DUF5060 domain-containing protein [Bacteroidales bacterium]|nr:DUF5060 domain-containing protein [Bacteroidales bacterium]
MPKKKSAFGRVKKWHKITLTFNGPEASETSYPNPFLEYRLTVTFASGNKKYKVPGFFAADGNASETSAVSGNKWRVFFVPDEEGEWKYTVSFRKGENIAISHEDTVGETVYPDGLSGTFIVGSADSAAAGFRSKGRLTYTGERYLQFAEKKEPFFKRRGRQS